MIRHVFQDGMLYVHADDLASAILSISEEMANDTVMTQRDAQLSSYVAERIALSIVGANLSNTNITAEDIGG